MKVVTVIIEDPREEHKYSALKTLLISRFTDTEKRHTKKLLTGIELEDRKPTELLCEMQLFAGKDVALVDATPPTTRLGTPLGGTRRQVRKTYRAG
ncbi:hypothetical protein WH47_11070 [Habropoda laboriosa]|uniref:Uncharacterized protein n=1 Tax=Habropoda laboriosa TaxID=597456 RepID=A0A0L7QM15_9HYME|nr:hypothetical protein WH47_11070 [Habropoda laboriosa]